MAYEKTKLPRLSWLAKFWGVILFGEIEIVNLR